ncbi:glucose-6-phosphate isomerase [Demequina aurantiaca]|uniref:glucose-6-phosphate isomerase n=1 Tax=Demequina aurantiaca TaxID=676200 RepID=UPI000A84622E|nr:glucose-6-phosphate isomerase [Demequina aurantiaca]
MSEFLSTWVGVDDAAHVAVTVSGDAARAASRLSEELVADRVASRIAAKDSTLWGPDAEAEAQVRLGWTDLHVSAREILPQLEALVGNASDEGKTHVVLAGMGGSSLGPEVICATYGVPLITLDSTDPDQVRAALGGDLDETILVVSSKSGGTVETDSQRRIFEEAFEAAGLDPRQHIVIVTAPDSPLHQQAVTAGYRAIFLADPNVGGRFSVLSAFGLVPSALAGVPVAELLDEAEAVAVSFAEDDAANPALVLGAAIAGSDRNTLVFTDEGSTLVGFADWAEQLIAESSGKDGVGILPVVAETGAPEALAEDVIDVRLVALAADGDAEGHQIVTGGTLGGQFLLWEYATAIAGRVLGIDPFNQPNVESAKAATRALLDALPEPEAPAFVDDGIEVRGTVGLLDGITSVEGAIAALYEQLEPRGYVAVMAYLNREGHPALPSVRHAIAERTGRPTTFGWGPRFLHSTGQLHKGGSPVGVFLQITGTFAGDLDIPARPFSFAQLISAQAAGDATVLAEHDRPVLRLNLTDASHVARVAALLEGKN